MKKILPFLWFEKDAENAANFYVSIFPNSKILSSFHSPTDTPSGPKGSILTINFELNGQEFIALNGGSSFKFNESISFTIPCKDQTEIDYYWEKLSAMPESEQCGWLKDKFGLSWQVVPENMDDFVKSEKAMQLMMEMKKIDIASLQHVA